MFRELIEKRKFWYWNIYLNQIDKIVHPTRDRRLDIWWCQILYEKFSKIYNIWNLNTRNLHSTKSQQAGLIKQTISKEDVVENLRAWLPR
jgi:hypothetical protein